ncbi:MAG TPA: carboxypeptidase-like regulatory domain-containing protein, partial [Prolixibacteraceae bacterium]|nr:carboxypeptidase-like regulatory domain-containing protein [Prolixibacteraceae bacterium]
MRKVLFMLTLCLAFSVSAMAQFTVTGKVTDSDGMGIPGASILEKGTTNGTITSVDGDYTLRISSANATLVFSFVGMETQEVAVAGRPSIDVTLKTSAIGLGEVVVTAMGVTKEAKKLGYAVTQVDGEKLAESTVVNPVNALQGRAAGVEIAPSEGGAFSGSKITIRGNSTLKGNNMPIFVVDGVIMDNNTSGGSQWGGVDWGNELKNLNADEFESVSVLKGAAATALYGSRALN